nr:hypothetical protein [Carrot vitivirus 1]
MRRITQVRGHDLDNLAIFKSGQIPEKSKETVLVNKQRWSLDEVCGQLIANGVSYYHFRSSRSQLNNIEYRVYLVGVLIVNTAGYQLKEFITEINKSVNQLEPGERPSRSPELGICELVKRIARGEQITGARLRNESETLEIRVNREKFALFTWGNERELKLPIKAHAYECSRLWNYRWTQHGINAVPGSTENRFELRGEGLRHREESRGRSYTETVPS